MTTPHLSRWHLAGVFLAALCGLFTSALRAQTPTVTTVLSGLSNPSGVAVDPSGNVYVGELNGQIRKVTPAGTASIFATTGVSYPYGMTSDPSGNIYVSNYGSNTVSKITPAGAVSTFATVGNTYGPIGLAYVSGNLFVASRSPTVIYKITSAGVVSQFATLPDYPVGMTSDTAGNLYVGYTNSFVSKVTPAGVVSTYASSTGYGYGMFFNQATGDLFLGGATGSMVNKVTSTGVVSNYATVGSYPWGMAPDGTGAFYVAVFGEGTLKKVGGSGFGVNFSAGTRTLLAADSPGIAFGGNWNNVANGSGSGIALNDHSGTATAARLTFSSTGANPGMPTPATSNAALNRLYAGALWGDNTTREISVTVTNVPYNFYDVYVYTYGGGPGTLSISNGQTTYYYSNPSAVSPTVLVQTTSTNPSAPTVGVAQYQVFQNQTASSFTLTTGGSINGVIANHIVGFQVVARALPPTPVITSATAATATVGSNFSYQITATNSPTSFGATGLPNGLSANAAGLISGTPTNAGTYGVTLAATNAAGTGNATLMLTVGKGAGSVTLGGLTHTYDGNVKGATATTAPGNYGVSFSYSGAALPPVNAGLYGVIATITDPNYQGSASGTLTINPAPVTITLSNLTQSYTGTPRSVSASTQPANVPVTVTYNGSASAPTAVGSYQVSASSASSNYSGTTTGTLVIRDAIPPVIAGPGNLVREATGPDGAAVTFTATANDGIDGAVAVTATPQSGSTFPVGNTTVTLTAQDAAGNPATQTFTVTVRDTTAPTLSVDGVSYAALPLLNPSFQGPVTSYWDAAISNWTMTVPSGAGVMSVVAMSGTFTGNKAPDGTQVLWINSGSVFQNTAATIQAGRTYVFSGYVGLRTDQPGGSGGRGSASLQTNDGTLLAKVVSGALTPGQFTPITVSYAVPAGSPAISKTLRVVLGNETTNVQVNFDAFTLAETSTLVFDATSGSGAPVAFNGQAVDLVSGNVPVTFSPASGSVLAVGSHIVTASAQDAAGNKTSLTFGAIVQDKVAPVISAPADLVREATGPQGAAVTFSATANDGIDGAVAVTASPASGSTFALGETTVTLTATDKAGNSSTATFKVTVRDTTAPALQLPNDLVVPATSAAGAAVSFSASATDAVTTSPVLSYSAAPGSVFPIGTSIVTVTARDAAGNTTEGSFSITVTDTIAPVIVAPTDLTAEAVNASGATVTFAASATDNIDGVVAVNATPASGSVFALGTTTVALTARDNVGNNASTSFKVTVVDTTAPALTVPGNQVLEATSATGAVATFAATATDAVTSAPTITYSVASGSSFALGTTTVTVTATDAAGNVATGSFTVTVRDTTAPAISGPGNRVAEATSAAGAVVSFSASADDIVDGAVSPTAVPASGSTFAQGVTTVTLSATDAAGNTSTSNFTVTVVDTTAPELTVPASQTLEATSAAGAVATFAASATDAVSTPVINYSVAPGSTFALGTTTVTVTATDAAGNATSGSFAVTVRDTTAPVLSVPANLTLEATSAAGAVATFAASATDSVTASPMITYSVAPGSTFAIGTTTVQITAKDAAGNTTSGSFTVTVRDTTAPVIGSVTASPNALWSPNKKMVPVTITAPVTDAVGATVRIVGVTTNEPDNTAQWQVTGDLTLNLKADRLGTGKGRVYTITVEAIDAAGNKTRSTVLVTVPHDQRK